MNISGWPARFECQVGCNQYFNSKVYYDHIYREACNLFSAELTHGFEGQNIPLVSAVEQALLKAANGDEYHNQIALLQRSCSKSETE